MVNGPGIEGFPRRDRFATLETVLYNLVDFVLAVHALSLEKGTYTQEEFDRMSRVVSDAKRRLSKNFSMEEGMKIIRASFRIENAGK